MKEIASSNQEKAAILKKLKSLGKEVDEEFLKEYEMIQEIDNSNEEELQNKLNEISVQI